MIVKMTEDEILAALSDHLQQKLGVRFTCRNPYMIADPSALEFEAEEPRIQPRAKLRPTTIVPPPAPDPVFAEAQAINDDDIPL